MCRARNRSTLLWLMLMFTPTYFYLLSGTVLPNVNDRQSPRKKSQHRRQQKKQMPALPAGYIVTSEDAQRVREALLAGTGNDHDDPMRLAEYGGIDSVPAMIAVLKRNPSNPDGGAVCTRWHCLVALQKVTKVNVGNKTEDWEKWWEEQQKKAK